MFYAYGFLLVTSGLAMIVTAVAFDGQGTGSQLISAGLGAGFLAYGSYLLIFFRPDQRYYVFFYLFVLPALVIYRAVRGGNANQPEPLPAQPFPGYPAPGQPIYPNR
jgi:hypothetical protein